MSTIAAAPRARRPSPLGLLASTDHKHIALLTGATALGFFFIAGLLALLMRAELTSPGLQVLTDDTYNQVFSMHGSTMFYLFASPIALAAAMYFVPLQIGASEIVWPRLALASFWLFAASGALMYGGFLTTQGANKAAWTGVDLLNAPGASPGTGQDFWIIGLALTGLSGILMAACVLATLVRSRAPGMTMLRIPVFSWGALVACLLTLAAYPMVVLAMVLLYLDRHGASVLSADSFEHLFWFFGHPVVYVVFFPFLGAVAEVVAIFSGKRFFGYRALVLSLLLFSALSISIWGHHLFTTGIAANKYFSLTTIAIAVPAGIEYFDMLATMFRGRIRLALPMLFGVGFLLQFLFGGLTGIFIASPPLNYHVHDTYFIVAHFHYTLFGGTVFGLFAAIYLWFPKITGRLLGRGLGLWQFWLMFLGGLLTFFPMFFLGHEGMVRRVADYSEAAGWETLNLVSTIGAVTLFAAFLLFVVNVARSLRMGQPAGPDPWGGHTLEWATSSPPPRHNFDALPPVRSHAPLLSLEEGDSGWEKGAGGSEEHESPAGHGGGEGASRS